MGPPPTGEEKIVVLKCVGGEIGSAAALAPKLGPLGLVSIEYESNILLSLCLLSAIQNILSALSYVLMCESLVSSLSFLYNLFYISLVTEEGW